MGEHFVHIEGDLEDDERERLLRLIRRVETAGDFPFEPEGLSPPWIIVAGRPRSEAQPDRDMQPVSISRLRVGLTFAGDDAQQAARRMERWLNEHEVSEHEVDTHKGQRERNDR